MGQHRCQYIWRDLSLRNKRKKTLRHRHNNSWAEKIVLVLLATVLSVFVCASAQAQKGLGGDQTDWTREHDPALDEVKEPKQPPPVMLPTTPAPPKTEAEGFPLERVFVKKIIVAGSTVFTADELAEITTPYANRELTAVDMEELRRALTLFYVNKGYVNSGAIIPDQTVEDGVIRLQVIEGELSAIEVEGNKWFRDSYIRNRIALDAGPPLNLNAVQKRLQFLQQDNRILLINAELSPGIELGESVMNVRVEEKSPVRLSLILDNYQSPSVGTPRGLFNALIDNLAGMGDTFDLIVGRSEGLVPLVETRYTLPITSHDTYLSLWYKYQDFEIVEEPFDPLDIETKVNRFAITLGHPFYRSLNNKFSMSLTGEYINSKTYLLGDKFSISPGAEGGDTIISVLRFSQEWTSSTQRQAIAARSRFSFGVDVFNATMNPEPIPDSQFFVWLGQFQWARVLGDKGIQLIFRTDVQLAAQSLLAAELISVGGRYTVRGYRENTLVRDSAVIASLESRIPLVRDRSWADYLQLVPFFDYGHGWNKDLPTPSLKTISSAGLGLRWAATLMKHPSDVQARFEIFWGYPFKHVSYEGSERRLQDEGIHFRFVLTGS